MGKSARVSLPSSQGKQAWAPGQPDRPFVGELGEGGQKDQGNQQAALPAF